MAFQETVRPAKPSYQNLNDVVAAWRRWGRILDTRSTEVQLLSDGVVVLRALMRDLIYATSDADVAGTAFALPLSSARQHNGDSRQDWV